MKQKNTAGRVALIALCILFLSIFLLLPLIFVLVQAFGKGFAAYWESITDKYTIRALLLTLKAAGISLAFNTVFGICAAWCLTRYRFCGQKLLNTFLDLPLSISPVIAGLMFILSFGRTSILYDFLYDRHIKLIFSVPGVILATVFVTLPYISREIIPVLNAIGTSEEEAAALMGASWPTIFFRITLPHIKWSLLYGIVLCSARAMGEFGAVSVISGHLRGLTNTLPLHIEILYNEFQYVPAFAASSLLVLTAVLLLILRSAIEARSKNKNESKGNAHHVR